MWTLYIFLYLGNKVLGQNKALGKNKNMIMKYPNILLFTDALFQEYYDWTYASYPAPYHLGNGEVEDFSLKGIRKRIQQCVEFHNKGNDLQPADEKYAIFKAIFQVKILPFNLF